jgi:hypothetical protein
VWLPLKTAVLDQAPRSGPAITVFALLAPGETIATAQAEMTTAGRRAATELPATHRHLEPRVRPYAMMAAPGAPGDQPIMYSIYFFTVVLLILICGNVGLLLFARAASREADLVVRTALGASRGRIVAQMFAEALVLGSVAAIVGVAAADAALRTWGTVFLETNLGRLPFWFDLSLSPRTIAVALVLTVASIGASAPALVALTAANVLVDGTALAATVHLATKDNALRDELNRFERVDAALAVAAAMQAGGFDIRAIRPPTVPEGSARLRVSVNVGVDVPVLDRFARLLVSALREAGVCSAVSS